MHRTIAGRTIHDTVAMMFVLWLHPEAYIEPLIANARHKAAQERRGRDHR